MVLIKTVLMKLIKSILIRLIKLVLPFFGTATHAVFCGPGHGTLVIDMRGTLVLIKMV